MTQRLKHSDEKSLFMLQDTFSLFHHCELNLILLGRRHLHLFHASKSLLKQAARWKMQMMERKSPKHLFLLLCLFSPSGGSKDGCVSLLRIVRFHPKTVCQLEWLHRTLDLREFRLGSLNVVTYLNASGQTQQQNAPCCKYIAVITEEHCP